MRNTSALASLGLFSFFALAAACSGTNAFTIGDADSGADAGVDATRGDSGSGDTGAGLDTGRAEDTSSADTSATDTGATPDTGSPDTGTADARAGMGCQTSAACPVEHACDTATGTCTTACSSTQPCNGGCCNNGTCAAGTVQTACGAAGAVCASCIGVASGDECLADGACGCKSASDCPEDRACDTATGTCTAACSLAQPCNGGCCSAGACSPGTSPLACGSAGTCASCTGLATGDACLASGTCGCNSADDCPIHQACDVATGTCTTACSPAQPCHGGCCNGGTCAVGAGQRACGLSGATCTSCVESALGTVCTAGGTCGCTTASQCPPDEACNPTSGMCGTICSAAEPCNGGCCNGGTCAPGTGQLACGTAASCVSCVGVAAGSACLPRGTCGCSTAADCPAAQSCGPTGACTACDPATEVSFGGHCYYLDGSGGVCDVGYSLQSNASLTAILAANANAWEGKTYRHTVSRRNCCVGTSNLLAEYGMTANCDAAGPFSAGQPVFDGEGCYGFLVTFSAPDQLTLCGL